jgi:protein-tyrosine phosphatase
MAGVSRSATVCIAYILQKLKVSLEDAVGLVKDANPDICPNDGFMKQLKAYGIGLLSTLLY